MPRHANPDLIKPWKVNLPATTAGSVEHLLFDPIHNRPRYAARAYLIDRLLNVWLDTVTGKEARPIPSLEEVLNARG